jgi:hypothetical protein
MIDHFTWVARAIPGDPNFQEATHQNGISAQHKTASKLIAGTTMVSRNLGLKTQVIAKCALSAIAGLGLLTLGGCSSSEPSASTQAGLARVELHFNLGECQQISPGLYKCPAADKPICNPDYNGQTECVRIGPKGSVFVQSGLAD